MYVNQSFDLQCRVLAVDQNGRPTSISINGTTNSACTGPFNEADGWEQDGGWYARFGGFTYFFSGPVSVNDQFGMTLLVTGVDTGGAPTSIEGPGGFVWDAAHGLQVSFQSGTGSQSYNSASGSFTITLGQSTTAVVD